MNVSTLTPRHIHGSGIYMAFNKKIHHRRSIRLPGYDYSQPNAYFVTICTFRKECLFGEVVGGVMRLNEVGRIVEYEWMESSNKRQEIELDECIIMPNHIHGIVIINDVGACGARPAPNARPAPSESTNNTFHTIQYGEGARHTIQYGEGARHTIQYGEGARHAPLRQMSKSLGSFIAGFKAAVTSRVRNVVPDVFCVWQRNYHERIIRNDRELDAIRRYIVENPLKWEEDPENPITKPKNFVIA